VTRTETRLYAVLTLIGAFAGGVVATQVAASVAMAEGRARTISAEQFVLLDSNGSHRAIMKVASDGTTHLAMYDGMNRNRADFRVTRAGESALGFYDQNGSPRVLVGEALGGRDGIAIYSTGGRQIATLSVSQDNQASLTLYDPNTGKARAGLGTASNGSPELVLFDQNGSDRAEIHVRPNGKPGIVLADENSKSIAGMPMHSASAQPIVEKLSSKHAMTLRMSFEIHVYSSI